MKKIMSTVVMLFAAFSFSLAVQAEELTPQALIQALAEGGKVIMMRHASTEKAEPAVSMNLSDDCSQEQNLSAQGRAEAKKIADIFQSHSINVEQVYTSEYCRARKTAEISFGGGEAWHALNLAETMSADDSAFLMLDVQEKMGDFVGKGNLVMVTHRSNINTITFQQTEPSEMVILQPDGLGNTHLLGTVNSATLSVLK
jgi:phosphohistidine phosphatase SixA